MFSLCRTDFVSHALTGVSETAI